MGWLNFEEVDFLSLLIISLIENFISKFNLDSEFQDIWLRKSDKGPEETEKRSNNEPQ